MSEDSSVFVVMHGVLTSTRSPVSYVANIVYGNPRIEAVLVGSHFVALCEFADDQSAQAKATFERMSSFAHGSQYILDRLVALQEFGTWVYHYAPGTIVGYNEEDDKPPYEGEDGA